MKLLFPILFLLSLTFTVLYLHSTDKSKTAYVPRHVVEKDVTSNPVIMNKDSVYSKGVYLPEVKDKGVIPDSITALRVAVNIAYKLYGSHVLEQTPYKIHRNGDLWVVSSSVPEKFNNIHWEYDRSLFVITINRYNGEIHDLVLR